MTAVAYIGLGSMGAPQARLLAASGRTMSVYDPSAPALDAFAGIARLARSPRDAAREAGIACVCVRDDQQVLDVVLGTDGLIDGLDRGALVLIHSTIRPQTMHRIGERLAERGIALVDAPVSRTRPTDDDRFVVTMLGGGDDDVERARAIVSAFSTEIVHLGPLGAGMAAKIANNLVTWVQIVVGTQAADIAAACGIPWQALRQIMLSNGNLTPTMRAMLDGRFARGGGSPEADAFLASQAGIGDKDLALAEAAAGASGVATDLIAATRAILSAAMKTGPG